MPIRPVRLRAGVTVESIEARLATHHASGPVHGDAGAAASASSAGPAGRTPGLITGRALIFWDPGRPGRKLDAIDTDQITPSTDCVSESLDTLDERWKAGAFRYLMPDFRKRVHAGENFVFAGERFAIGSSREMSPAGLKAIAEEAGLTMVIVCAANMGDIFRRNALNLGLQVVQSPEAVEEVKDGDEFRFDPVTRGLENVTQGRRCTPVPLTPKEDEIRKTGGIFAVGRREFAASLRRASRVEFPPPSEARRMTASEQIVWAHRVDRSAEVRPGATLLVEADLLPASDGTAPFAIHTFRQITGGDTIHPRQAAIANDHFVFTGVEADDRQTSIGREFAAQVGMTSPHYAAPGAGIFHFYFPEQGLIVPGGLIPGADSHSRAYGAYGAMGIGVGSTTLGFGWSTGAIFMTVAEQRRVRIVGRLQPWVTGKDVVLHLLRRWGAAQSRGMGVEFHDENLELPMPYRNTIANMMAEAEAQNGIFPQDAVTEAWFASRGIAMPYPAVVPGREAVYAIDEDLDLSEIVPLIAKPFSPGNAVPAGELAKERITFDKAMIGSCTNGSYDDLLSAALVLRRARARGIERVARGIEFIVFPGSGRVKQEIENADPRLDGESVAGVLRAAGAGIRTSWCGPCFGQGPDALQPGQRAITSFNRNWTNRMGIGGEGYLASPSVVAASALAGYMAAPADLGLEWEPEMFGG